MYLRYIHNLLISALLLSACSMQGYRPEQVDLAGGPGNAEVRHCLSLYSDMDTYLYHHGLADVQDYRIPGYPFLRINRFLASYRDELANVQQSQFWLRQLAQLDRQARLIEIRTIQAPDIAKISQDTGDREKLAAQVTTCSGLLTDRAAERPEVIADISSRAVVPDNYNPLMRVFGIYPLSSFFVLFGINNWHEKTMAAFEKHSWNEKDNPGLLRYQPGTGTPAPAMDLAAAFNGARNNPLFVPLFDDESLQSLFERYAPVWEIETLQDADHFGVPDWHYRDSLHIDTGKPVVYDYVSYTRIHDHALLQLNYTIWFPARPVTGWLDILGGKLDGITWRVTLDENGRPAFYDTIHNCGCYHMVFPDKRYRLKDMQQVYEEPLLVPAVAPVVHAGERMIVSVASGTHYIVNIQSGYPDPRSQLYTFADYNNLRELPAGAGSYRSMFDQRGLVPGSERKERWILWPMGIIEPGAMRQRGHHATAFIGKRHFDDPFLFQEYFTGPG